MDFAFPVLATAQIVAILVSIRWYFKRNDEIPLLMSFFLFYIASFRYWAVSAGLSGWTDISNLGLDPIDNDAAAGALALMVLGEVVLLATYMRQQRAYISVSRTDLPPALEQSLRPIVFTIAILAIPAVVAARVMVNSEAAAGKSTAFEISNYLGLAPMMLTGIGCLLILLWKFGAFKNVLHQLLMFALIIVLFWLTYSPSERFTFLGWLLGGAVILSTGYAPAKRALVLSGMAVLTAGLFALAGASRDTDLSNDVLGQAAWERAASASDANMLDGFLLMEQIYPARLNYSFGMEHLEILERPIPRSLWPGKPVGGYMNKLGLTTASTGFTVGISPSLFGSFYMEGGIFGIILFSILYGWAAAALVSWSLRMHPFGGVLIRGMICAGLIPLLRGGDLPGIYAWLGMAFWPCGLLLWWYRKEIFQSQIGVNTRNPQPMPQGIRPKESLVSRLVAKYFGPKTLSR